MKKKKEVLKQNKNSKNPIANSHKEKPFGSKKTKQPRFYADNVSERIVKIIPLGGLEQIGMNMTAFEYGRSIIVVDCGLAFPSDDMPGIDLVVPDTTYLEQNASMVRGIFITHGHEDHIGGLPYVLRKIQAPIYATPLSMGIIENHLDEHDMKDIVERKTVHPGDRIEAGDFSVEFIHVNHSITDATALAISSPAGTILHTGDFKIDYTPVHGNMANLERFSELGKKGVLALLSDSTNAIRPGFTPSEQTIADFFDKVFNDYPKNRIMIATFASNLDRMQQIMQSAKRYNRKVAVEGHSMLTIIELARELGYCTIPENVFIDIEDISDYPDEKICILMTGSQGEAMSALTRVASGQHRKISITKNDIVIFSSTPIPGNEKAVNKVMNDLAKRGAEIINRATHVSGHACEEELKLIYALTKPKYAIPVHGEYRHRQANAAIASSMHIKKDHILLVNSGDVISLSDKRAEVTDTVPHGGVMIDGLGVGDVGNSVLRDRQNLSRDGIVVISAVISSDGMLLTEPEADSRGFVYVKDSENLLEEIRLISANVLSESLKKHPKDKKAIAKDLREAVTAFTWETLQRKPLVLPILTEMS